MAAAELVAGGTFPAEHRGGAAVTPEGGVRPRNSHGTGGILIQAPILPNFVTPLGKGVWVLELPQVDQISDIVQQLVEKEDRLDQGCGSAFISSGSGSGSSILG